jgi:hypothetical protein
MVSDKTAFGQAKMFVLTYSGVFVILDELCAKGGPHDHKLAHVSDAEVLTVAVVAARYFQNHHERALLILRELG